MRKSLLTIAFCFMVFALSACGLADDTTDTDDSNGTAFSDALVGTWTDGSDTYTFTASVVTVVDSSGFWDGTYEAFTDAYFTTTDADVYTVMVDPSGSGQVLYIYAKVNADGTAEIGFASDESYAISSSTTFTKQ